MLKYMDFFHKTLQINVLRIQSMRVHADVSVLLTRSYEIIKH